MEFQKLQRIIADVLNISEDKITPESTFVDDLKADSLDVFQIITEIEDQFEIQIPDDAAEHITTVGDAVSQIIRIITDMECRQVSLHNMQARRHFYTYVSTI